MWKPLWVLELCCLGKDQSVSIGLLALNKAVMPNTPCGVHDVLFEQVVLVIL